MSQSADVCIYGDSIMRGTIPVAFSKYKFTVGEYLDRLAAAFPLKILNRARFGAPITKGAALLKQDLEHSITAKYALLEFGGNDCNFDWAAVSAFPDSEHFPKTSLATFTETLDTMTDDLARAGSQPVLMTLPPIDAEKYLDTICAAPDCCRENILHWLGDTQMIYRFQELYSDAISKLAARKNLTLVDVRSLFLDKRNYKELISEDGIHPSSQGYSIILSAFQNRLESLSPASV